MGRTEITLSELAARLSGKLIGPDGNLIVTGVSTLRGASSSQVCYYGNPRYRKFLSTTKAIAVIVDAEVETSARNQILTDHAHMAFRESLILFRPDRTSGFEGISPHAVVHESAVLGEGVNLGAYTVVDRSVRIGERSSIGAGCFLGPFVRVGKDCEIHPRVVLEADTVLGDRVIIHSGAVLGSDGFGFVPDPDGHKKIPQNGNVVVEDDVEIGANTCIDRSVVGSTVICRHTKLDNLIHLAHNVTLGPGCFVAAQTGIAGSTKVGSGVLFAGQSGIVGHLEIGDRAVVTAQSGVDKDIPAGETVSGSPARPHRRSLRIAAVVSRLPEFYRAVRKHLEETSGE